MTMEGRPVQIPPKRSHTIIHDWHDIPRFSPAAERPENVTRHDEGQELKPIVIMLWATDQQYRPNMLKEWQEDVRVFDALWDKADTDNITLSIGIADRPGFDDTEFLTPPGQTAPADIDVRELGDFQGSQPDDGWMTFEDWKDWYDDLTGSLDPLPRQVMAWGELVPGHGVGGGDDKAYNDFLNYLEDIPALSVIELEDFSTHPADAIVRWLRHINTLLQLIRGIEVSEIKEDSDSPSACKIIGGTPA